MTNLIYKFNNGEVSMKGNLLESKETYEGKEERRTHIKNGLHSTRIADVTSFAEKWEIEKTNGDKEIINIKKMIWTDDKTKEVIDKEIFWDDFSHKVVYDEFDDIELAKEYGVFIEEEI